MLGERVACFHFTCFLLFCFGSHTTPTPLSFLVLRPELRPLCWLGKHLITEVNLQPLLGMLWREIGLKELNFFFSLHDDNDKNAFKKLFLLVMVYNKGVQEGAGFASLFNLFANAWQPQRPFQRHCPVACSILLGDKMEATCWALPWSVSRRGDHRLSSPGQA